MKGDEVSASTLSDTAGDVEGRVDREGAAAEMEACFIASKEARGVA